MNAPRDPDQMIHAFLMEGEDQLQDPIYDAVRAEIEQKRQRTFIGPWSTPAMNKITFGLGAAAVVLIGAFLGAQLLGSPGNTGAGGPSATPEPTATSEPTPEPTTPAPTDFAAVEMGVLTDGDYVFTHIDGVRVVFTASPVWERNFPDWVVWSIDDNKATMGVSTVQGVAVDPCQPELGLQDPAVGPTVDDLVVALRSVPGLTFSAPAEVTQDGYSGVRLDYVPPDGFDNCLEDLDEAILMKMDGEPDSESVIYAPFGDDRFSVYIFDVDGTRVVIAAAYTEDRTDELDELLGSIRFEQP